MSEHPDSLFHVMSSDLQMGWQRYRDVYDVLHRRLHPSTAHAPFGIRRSRWETLEFMESLGHCETRRHHDMWYVRVAPSVLARLPLSGSPVAVTAGSRTPGTVAHLADVARDHGVTVEVENQATATLLVPDRVTVRASSGSGLASFADALGMEYQPEPPAWLLANVSPGLNEYLASAQWETRQPLNWDHDFFEPAALAFVPTSRAGAAFVLRRYYHPVQGRPVFELRRDDGTRVHDADPNWARYCVLNDSGERVLAYDVRRFIMAVPAAAPLPRLLARALSLCSGFAPDTRQCCGIPCLTQQDREFHLYRSVPPEVAGLVCEKLGQTIGQCTINTNQ